MTWKEKLRAMESAYKWDNAIAFIQKIIAQNPNDMDAYMCMNYLLMNLLVEEAPDYSKDNYYQVLTKRYFDESYAKFSENAEFLYIAAKIAVMSPWYFGIEREEYEAMIEKAKKLEPENFVYKENYYWDLEEKDPTHPELIAYCEMILSDDSLVYQRLSAKGAVGEYLLELKHNYAKRTLKHARHLLALNAIDKYAEADNEISGDSVLPALENVTQKDCEA